jgi:hypothetical protein
MRLQLADPSDHPLVVALPFGDDLAQWHLPHTHEVLGLHRHVVRLIELGEGQQRTSYVVKELPDRLAAREYRLLRGLREDRLPTVDAIGLVTDRSGGRDGLLVTRYLDYSLPYRTLLSRRGATIADLGQRLLEAMVGLLVRLHLAGFYWGDCSLSNILFRRDAGALQAYVLDVETSERYETLTSGQRQLDVDIATENVAGGLLDLQAGGILLADLDPWEIATSIETSYRGLWSEVTRTEEFSIEEMSRLDSRLRRLNQLGFDVAEMQMITDDEGQRLKLRPRVAESGYHQDRLFALTGLRTGENQARRLLDDIGEFGAEIRARTDTAPSELVTAARWLDQRFTPSINSIPLSLVGKLEPAEIYHQLLEHRWYESERRGFEVPLEEALESYVADVLARAPDEHLQLDAPTAELRLDPSELLAGPGDDSRGRSD